jgi:hypothetical protein
MSRILSKILLTNILMMISKAQFYSTQEKEKEKEEEEQNLNLLREIEEQQKSNPANQTDLELLKKKILEYIEEKKKSIRKRSANYEPFENIKKISNSVNILSRKNKQSEVSYASIQNIEFLKNEVIVPDQYGSLKKEELKEIINLLEKCEKEGFFNENVINNEDWTEICNFFENLDGSDLEYLFQCKNCNKIQNYQSYNSNEISQMEKKLKSAILEMKQLQKIKRTFPYENKKLNEELRKREAFVNQFLLMNDRINQVLVNEQDQKPKEPSNFNSPFNNQNFYSYYDSQYAN